MSVNREDPNQYITRDDISWWYLQGFYDYLPENQVNWGDHDQWKEWRLAYEQGIADRLGAEDE